MKKNDFWEKFVDTGSIQDYLAFKSYEHISENSSVSNCINSPNEEHNYVDYNRGDSDSRTSSWR